MVGVNHKARIMLWWCVVATGHQRQRTAAAFLYRWVRFAATTTNNGAASTPAISTATRVRSLHRKSVSGTTSNGSLWDKSVCMTANHSVESPLSPYISSQDVSHEKQQQQQQQQQDEDTIYAVSSGSPTGQPTAVAVIRLSGPHALSILQLLSPSIPPINQQAPKPRMATLRKLYHPVHTNTPLDQALVLYFPQPHSFTGEDVVEIHAHGSRAVVQGILRAIQDCQPLLSAKMEQNNNDNDTTNTAVVRYAEAGEFSSRAWMHGKLDVLQIEALADLLMADTDTQRNLALQQLDGQLSAVYETWRQELIAGLAHAEAVIDFGDDEQLGMDDDDDESDDAADTFNPQEQYQTQQASVWGGIVERMDRLQQAMQRQLLDERRGELVREGLQIAIVGPPNAGKSSLFNVLAKRDAAIVSPTAGTTRDVLEISLNLGGVKCTLQDTAGMHQETDDAIELEGMKRALRAAQRADFAVVMVDATEATSKGHAILKRVLKQHGEGDTSESSDDDAAITSTLHLDQVFLVRNKNDLVVTPGNGESEIADSIAGVFDISCLTQDGIDDFLDALTNRVISRVHVDQDDSGSSRSNTGGIVITRARHRQHVLAATEALARFSILSQRGSMALDMAAEELRLAASEVGRITGAVDVEDVLDKLFADFCIGK